MSNKYFEFKKFTIHQDRCAMKVGTDGTLLGAWASAPAQSRYILDIGTGTGLIALMMAQRYPEAQIVGIDIDDAAVAQATENVAASPFAERISILKQDVTSYNPEMQFDAIVSNPPYFVDSLTCPDEQRSIARHAVTLTFEALIKSAYRLLKTEGTFSVVIPTEMRSKLEASARLEGFFISKVCCIKTTPKKPSKRQLIEFTKAPVKELVISEGILETSPNTRSDWYQKLTNDFYIR
jgi:tRNA1Val (adenine37-N6)-methyltransferase